jgi:hypothetical protein
LIAGSMHGMVLAMHETHDKPDGGLIVYAGFVY